MDKRFWAGAFTLTGTIIGAGILGLPYVFSKSGFLIGVFWLVFLGLLLMLTKLYLGEVCLRTKGDHQLIGYARRYLGKWGKRIMIFGMCFGIYSALIAYLIGEGESFSALFLGNARYAILFGFIFWLIMTLLLREGLKGLKKVETWGVIAIIIIIIAMLIWYSPNITSENLIQYNFSKFLLPIGVVLFALHGYTAIPEVKRELNGYEKILKKAIIFGALIPIILYIIFSLIFVEMFGANVPEIATLSLGKFVIILGIFTMLTSYFVLSFALKDMFRFDLRYSKNKIFFFVSILPLAIYLFISIFKIMGFVSVLGIGGVISGGIIGVSVLFMNKKAKIKGNRKPEYQIPINWFIISLLTLIYTIGMIAELIL